MAALFFFFLSAGSIYQWTDKNGVRHYSNTQAPQGMTDREVQISREIQQKIEAQSNAGYQFDVIKVYDGDTILVRGMEIAFKVRLVGIDAPENGYKARPGQPFSRKATQYLKSKAEHQKVTLKSYGTGGYNRQLAEVFINGRNLNIEMIKSGMAEVYKGRLPKTLKADEYVAAERSAKDRRLGIWSQGASYRSPKLWRKEHPIK